MSEWDDFRDTIVTSATSEKPKGEPPVAVQRVVRGAQPTKTKMKTGIELIADERARQTQSEGWTAEHDDLHVTGEMAIAAATYILHGGKRHAKDRTPSEWPWCNSWWKPSSDHIRNLVKAGALIAAEIDRLQRASNAGTELPARVTTEAHNNQKL